MHAYAVSAQRCNAFAQFEKCGQVLRDALGDLLASPDARLFTLVGIGGMGKTRLAIVAATKNMDACDDGLYGNWKLRGGLPLGTSRGTSCLNRSRVAPGSNSP
jgi:hypothetical protein